MLVESALQALKAIAAGIPVFSHFSIRQFCIDNPKPQRPPSAQQHPFPQSRLAQLHPALSGLR